MSPIEIFFDKNSLLWLWLKISKILHFGAKWRIFFKMHQISKNEKNSKILKWSHSSEFLSKNISIGLIFSGICHTFRLEQNKILFAILKLIKNTKHPAEEREFFRFSLSRKIFSFSKSAYWPPEGEKIEIFSKFCFFEKLQKKTRRMSRVGISYDKSSSL